MATSTKKTATKTASKNTETTSNTKSPASKSTASKASHADHVDDTVELVKAALEKKSSTGAAGAISKWITVLKKDENLSSIADSLEELKEAIASKDGARIAELMNQAGEETTQAAEDAEGGEAKKVKMLGKALISASKAIAKLAK